MEIKVYDNKVEIYENKKLISYAKVEKNHLKEIFVNEEYRNISYGRRTIQVCLNELKKRGYDSLIVEEFDMAEYNFFKKLGFKIQNNSLILEGLQAEFIKEKAILNTSIISFILNLFLAILKLSIGLIFSISSITADGINAASDCITNLIVILGAKISNKPEDEKHPFGYGKVESIFSIIIGSIIVMSSATALLETIKKLFNKFEILDLGNNKFLIISFSIIFIILKILQYIYVRFVAIKYDNVLLKAVLKDYLSDILVSISVLVGIALSLYVSNIFDIILGIILNLFIISQGIGIIKENSTTLMDTQDDELLSKVKKILLEDNNIKQVHDLYMISSNKNVYIYADVRVDKNLSVEKSHEIAEHISLIVRKKINIIKRLTLHIEPIY